VNDVTDMVFDQYQRYRLVADILEQVRVEEQALDILDVGGRTALLRRFLPGDEVHLVDMEASPEPGLVLGDGARLPFKDQSFDAVVTFDTLEHVPPAHRAAFVSECRRVSRNWVVIAGPYDTPGVAQAEEDLKVFLDDKLEIEHRYLNEHNEHGLPSREDTVSELMALGGQVSSIGHGNLERWLVLMCLSLYMDRDAPLREMATRFHQFYNRSLYESDHVGPVYRHAIVASFQNEEPPTARSVLGEPGAPAGTLESFRQLAEELMQFDVKREVWQAEWDRLAKVNEGNLKDVAGHEKRIESLEGELEDVKRDYATSESEHEDVEEKLRVDLNGQIGVRADLEADLSEHGVALSAVKADLAQTIERYEADITNHVAGLEETRQQVEAARIGIANTNVELDQIRLELGLAKVETNTVGAEKLALKAELAAHVTHKEELEGELARMHGVAEEIQNNLIAANESLAERNGLIENWRLLLRSRKKNLLRAFSFKKPQF